MQYPKGVSSSVTDVPVIDVLAEIQVERKRVANVESNPLIKYSYRRHSPSDKTVNHHPFLSSSNFSRLFNTRLQVSHPGIESIFE